MSEWDSETERLIRQYCGRDPRTPIPVKQEALSEYGSARWSLSDFLEEINKAVSKIPIECRESAVVDLEGDYDETTVLKITYTRLQTEKEVLEAVQRAEGYVEGRKQQERRQYESLKRKFEIAPKENPAEAGQ